MNMYIYIYTCSQICVCLNIQKCTQVCMHHTLYINAYVYVYAYVNTRIYIHTYIYVYICIYVYMYIYLSISLSYLSIFLSIYLSIYLILFYESIYIYMHIVHVVFGITLRSLKAFSSPTHKIIPSPPFWSILPEDIPSLISMLPDTSFTATMPGCGSGCRAILGEIIRDPDPATRMITQVLKDTQPKSEHVWRFIEHARLLGFTSL